MTMTISFRTTNNNYKIPSKSNNYDKNLPIKIAAVNTVFWTGVGLGTDYLIMNKMLKMKTTPKQSLIFNGLFGLGMGIYMFFKTKKMQKEENVKNFDDFVGSFTNNK